jgi:methylthioribose-1-phosphate isomerase
MRAIEWDGKEFKLLDQTKLPHSVEYIRTDDYHVIIDAIKRLAVRGAPAIGIAAAFALAFASGKINRQSPDEYLDELGRIATEIESARPTAVNLRWAIRRLLKQASAMRDVSLIPEKLIDEAERIRTEDIEMCRNIGIHGAALLPESGGVITHCNTGALATGDYGTAQSVIVTAIEQGKRLRVFVDETRPLFQGARLTMYELRERNIDATLITDNTAAFVMRSGKVHAVITGADRIAANGDTANKIGTYGLAVLAKHHGIPLYVAAPSSTIDMDCPDGNAIPIEERDPQEVTHPFGMRIAPDNINVYSPAFDVTPNELISAIITEQGVVVHPLDRNLRKLSAAGRVEQTT